MGPAWARVADALGLPFLPWHHQVADVLGEIDPDTDQYAYVGAVITTPRQSAKTTFAGAAMEHRVMTRPGARVWYTEKSQNDAREWLAEEHAPLVRSNPVFDAQARIRIGNNAPSVSWPRLGSKLGVFSPNARGIKGKQSDLTVIDECQEIDADRGRAIDRAGSPTQVTRPGAQTWKMGTAGTIESSWWLKSILRGRADVEAGRRSGIAYFDWSCPDELDPTAPESWPLFHPAYGFTIDDAGMRAQIELLGDLFPQEMGNQWPAGAVSGKDVITEAAFTRVTERAELPAGGVVFGVAPAAARENAAVVAAWRDEDGMIRADLSHYEDGLQWVMTGPKSVPMLLASWPGSAVGMANETPDLVVSDPLTRGGVDVATLTVREFAAATGYLIGLVDTGHIRVCPSPRMAKSVEEGRLRSVGQGSAWLRRGRPSASAVVALTVAVWTLEHVEPEAEIIPFRIG